MLRRLAPLAVVALLAGCGGSHAARPAITASATTALLDSPPRVVVRGLKARSATLVSVSTVDRQGKPFVARATVRADKHGVVHVPLPMLLSSLHPPGVTTNYYEVPPRSGERVVIAVDGRTVRLRLLLESPHLIVRDLRPRTDGIYGNYYALPSTQRRPAVVLFGGSEGRLFTADEAAVLASHGLPALALAYFKEPGLPRTLKDIPLEYFVHALRWLARQPGVDPQRLVVAGWSRGSEAALLVAAHFPALVHAVVATSPSSVVVCSFPADEVSAWTLRGRPLPCAKFADPYGSDPIPIQRFHGRVLLVCGGGDQIWESCLSSKAIVARRRGLPTTLLEYPLAGHGVASLVPNGSSRFQNDELAGFDPDANAKARIDAWPKLLRFLTG